MTRHLRFVPVRGASLAVTDEGDGPAVLWAYGLTSSAWGQEHVGGMFDWSPLVSAGYRVVRYDARGHGGSSGQPAPADYRFSQLADDLLTVAQVVSPNEPVSIIGCSMGTAAALHAATARPDRVRRLVLTAPPTAWEARVAQRMLYERLADVVEQQGISAFTAMVEGAPAPSALRAVPGFPPPLEVPEDLLPAVLRGVAASDLPPRQLIADLSLPTLILPWEGDSGHPVSVATELAALVHGATMELASTAQQIGDWGRRVAQWLQATEA